MFFWGLISRRKSRRLPVKFTCRCHIVSPARLSLIIGKKEFKSSVVEISRHGAGLISPYALPEQAKLLVKFKVCESEEQEAKQFFKRVKFFAQVKTCEKQDDKRYRIGIEFKDIINDRKVKLDKIIHSIKRGSYKVINRLPVLFL